MPHVKNIYLIGYRCTGKSTIGKMLAASLRVPFIDTDDLIQEKTGMTIAEFVAASGWKAFRQMEKDVLKDCMGLETTVISTGGGIVLDEDNRTIIRENGFCIWLTADEATILERLSKDRHTDGLRPPLSDFDAATETREMMRIREPLYRQTRHLAIDTGMRTPEESVSIICRSLENVRI